MELKHPSAECLASALNGKKLGKSYVSRCPAHTDNSPSFSITEKAGKTLVKCWAGCSQSDVLEALRNMNLWPRKREPSQIIPLVDMDNMRRLILAHQENLRLGIPVSISAEKQYHWNQSIWFQPYSAAEVAEMQLYCLCYSADVRKGMTPGPDADELFLLYSRVVDRLGVPLAW